MRPSSSNKRLRGRSRKGPNPLTRSFESNGPDVKIRGTAMHIAEKYVQLARDAQVSGDGVMAEAYFQHAEHYFRTIAAAQPQMTTNGQADYGRDDEGDDEFDGQRGEFNNRPEPYGQPQPQPQPQRGNGAPYQGGYQQRDNRGYEGRDDRGQGQRGNDQRGGDHRSQEGRGDEGRGYGDNRPRDGRSFEGQRSQHEPRQGGESRRFDRAPNHAVNGNTAAAPAAPLPGLGPQPDLEPRVVAEPRVPVEQPVVEAVAAPVSAPAPVEPVETAAVAADAAPPAEDGAPRPRRRSRGSRGRGRRADGTAGGEEGDGGEPALPFSEDGPPAEG